MKVVDLLGFLKSGESSLIEFKAQLDSDFPKDACAFANTQGGKVLIGVEDDGNPIGVKDLQIKQKISDRLQGLQPIPTFTIEEVPMAETQIVMIDIKESPLLVSYKNVVYIRAGINSYPLSIEQVIEKSAESLRVFFDEIPSRIPSSELDRELFENYLKRRKKVRGISIKGTLEENAIQMKVLKKVGQKLVLTNGGLMCFTKHPQDYVSSSSVRLVVFDDEEMKTYSNRREFLGPLQLIVEELEEYFSKNLNRVGGFTLGFRAGEFLEYPFDAIREAIMNAIIHRNYFDPSETQIFMFPSRLEIKNPGSFPPGVSVDEPEHKPRNPSIAQYFYDLGLAEKYGSGIKKIISAAAKHPLSDVEFDIKPYKTKVVFRKKNSNLKLDEVNRKILEFLVKANFGSTKIAEYVGLSRQATISRLNDLVGLGLIKQLGNGPSTEYHLIRQ